MHDPRAIPLEARLVLALAARPELREHRPGSRDFLCGARAALAGVGVTITRGDIRRGVGWLQHHPDAITQHLREHEAAA